ncbi:MULTISPECIES: hypothetical protein, partial [unclassified Blastomonas]|uniref:hypothetical protein n=1 Tax=unclassified Blastomonas TaxID=2626550 RepID=UPI00192095D6
PPACSSPPASLPASSPDPPPLPSHRTRKDLPHEHSRHRSRFDLLGHPHRHQRRPWHDRLIHTASTIFDTGNTIMNVIATALAAISSIVFIAASIGPGVIV